MLFLRNVAPLIVFSALTRFGWQTAALAALAVSLIAIAAAHRSGARGDALVLDVSMVCYFVAVTALAFAVPDSPLQPYTSALLPAWLAVVALIGLAAGRPFTLGIARTRVAPEVANSPEFRRNNIVISGIWTACFAFIAATGVGGVALNAGMASRVAFQLAGLGLAAVATWRYAVRIRARRDAVTQDTVRL